MKYEFMPNLGSYQFFLVLIIFLVLPTQAAGGGWFDCYQNRDVSDFELLDEHCKAQGGELIVNPYPNSSTQYRCRCDTSRRQELRAQDMACQACYESGGQQCEQCHQCGNGGSNYYAMHKTQLDPLIESCRSMPLGRETRGGRVSPPGASPGGGNGPSTGGAGDPVPTSPTKSAGQQEATDACKAAHKRADTACRDPMKAAFGVSIPPEMLNAIVLGVGGVGAGAMSGSKSKSVQKACKIARGVGYGSAAMNTAFAVNCYSSRSRCISTCQETVNALAGAAAAAAQQTAQASLNACRGFTDEISMMATQAAVSMFGGEMARMCENLAKVDTFDIPPPETGPPSGGPDCSDPAYASNPICLDCRSPESRNNPMCRSVGPPNPGEDGGRSNQSSERPGGPGEYDLGGLGLDGDGTQVPDLPIIPPGTARGPSGGGGGGGGLPGGGGPQGYEGEGGGHGPSGINTDILHGLGGGGGYSTSNVPLGGGGGGGFGPGRAGATDEGDKFDLRKFLPGRQGVKGLQKISGSEASRHPELAPSHDNLWRRVSAKYQQLCQRGELYGCQ